MIKEGIFKVRLNIINNLNQCPVKEKSYIIIKICVKTISSIYKVFCKHYYFYNISKEINYINYDNIFIILSCN